MLDMLVGAARLGRSGRSSAALRKPRATSNLAGCCTTDTRLRRADFRLAAPHSGDSMDILSVSLARPTAVVFAALMVGACADGPRIDSNSESDGAALKFGARPPARRPSAAMPRHQSRP